MRNEIIMIKIRDEIQINPQNLNQAFNISNPENYQIDVDKFYSITQSPSFQNEHLDIKPDLNILSEIAIIFNLKINFLYNQIYKEQKFGEINTLIESIFIDNSNQFTNRKQFFLERNIPNFYNFFYIELPDDIAEEKIIIIEELLREISVTSEDPKRYILDYVQLRNIKNVNQDNSNTEALFDEQYRTQMGFDEVRNRQDIVGRNGKGIIIVDCESAWGRFDGIAENDFPLPNLLTGDIIHLDNLNTLGGYPVVHGTQVLSVLKSQNICVKPIVSEAKFGCSTVQGSLIEVAIMRALNHINGIQKKAGIILIEQNYYSAKFDKYFPVETIPSVFFVIRLAYELKITVVEPSGNSELDLDKLTTKDMAICSWLWYRNSIVANVSRLNTIFAAGVSFGKNATIKTLMNNLLSANIYTNSGAIIVGGIKTVNSVRTELKYNHGENSVFCFAQAENVPSFEYNPSGRSGSINIISFNGTSASSAIIAGIVTIIQSIYLIKIPRATIILSPDEIKKELRLGFPIGGGLKVPNIMKIIANPGSKIHI